MIRQTLTADVLPDDDLIAYLESQREILQEVIEEVHSELEPEILAELEHTPPPAKYPIEWTSERQRKAFFATNGFGKGIPTKRSGKLQESWLVYIKNLDEGVGLVIENKAKYAKYVYGSLAQDRTQALRFQQPFHANTGWQEATDTVAFWLDAADELIADKLDQRLGDFAQPKTTRRAYTQGTRR